VQAVIAAQKALKQKHAICQRQVRQALVSHEAREDLVVVRTLWQEKEETLLSTLSAVVPLLLVAVLRRMLLKAIGEDLSVVRTRRRAKMVY